MVVVAYTHSSRVYSIITKEILSLFQLIISVSFRAVLKAAYHKIYGDTVLTLCDTNRHGDNGMCLPRKPRDLLFFLGLHYRRGGEHHGRPVSGDREPGAVPQQLERGKDQRKPRYLYRFWGIRRAISGKQCRSGQCVQEYHYQQLLQCWKSEYLLRLQQWR